MFHDVGGVFHHAGTDGRVPGPDPQRTSYGSFLSFGDPDGNGWLLQEVTARLPGRLDPAITTFASAEDLASALRRAAAAHGEHEARIGAEDPNWPDWYAQYMVRGAGRPNCRRDRIALRQVTYRGAPTARRARRLHGLARRAAGDGSRRLRVDRTGRRPPCGPSHALPFETSVPACSASVTRVAEAWNESPLRSVKVPQQCGSSSIDADAMEPKSCASRRGAVSVTVRYSCRISTMPTRLRGQSRVISSLAATRTFLHSAGTPLVPDTITQVRAPGTCRCAVPGRGAFERWSVSVTEPAK